jgi:opacity protein-like surface antigen
MKQPKFLLTSLFALLTLLSVAKAGHPVVELDNKGSVPDDGFPYVQGAKEIEFDGAVFQSVGTRGTAERPDVGFGVAELRAGWMLTNPIGGGLLRGNLEILGEIFGGGIYDGPGSDLVGFDAFLRWNFVQPGAKFVPFVQAGGGGVYSDAAQADKVQRLIGSDFSFSLEAEIGVRYMIDRNWAINVGLEYRHISNADTASRNRGLNALGGVLGVNRFF